MTVARNGSISFVPNDGVRNFKIFHALNGDPAALALMSKTEQGIPCYVVHEGLDPYNNGPSDPMALVSCKPLQPGDSFA